MAHVHAQFKMTMTHSMALKRFIFQRLHPFLHVFNINIFDIITLLTYGSLCGKVLVARPCPLGCVKKRKIEK